MNQQLLDELFEWLRIPSISSGGGDPADIRRAAEWAVAKIARAGGEAEVVETKKNPMAVGRLAASRPDAPTVLIYGHYDVQSADPVDAWTSPPFEPQIRDGRIYARGAADDKGNFFPLLFVACELASRGELPVNVRVLVEGEEEVTGNSALEWVAADEEGADCAIVFDSEMLDPNTPAVTLGVRGVNQIHVKVRAAAGDLHSGLYGGSVLNAVHVLHQVLAAVMPGPEGLLRDELREGVVDPAPEELETWSKFPPADEMFEQVGGRPIHARSGDTYYRQNWADASIDINGIEGGDAIQQRTIIPATASARLTMRIAPTQDAAKMAQVLEQLLLDAAPDGADVEIKIDVNHPALFDPNDPAIAAGIEAIGRACGAPTALIRSGGSIPVLAAFAKRGIPTILSGFTLPEDAFHAPDESFRVKSVELAEASARELYAALGTL